MAILSDSNETENDQDIITRLYELERTMYELNLSLENSQIGKMLQDMRLDTLEKAVSLVTDKQKFWKEHLVFNHKDIVSDDVYRGDVSSCYEHITKDLKNLENRHNPMYLDTYIGSTCNPQRRIKEHFDQLKKTNVNPSLSMNILYHSTQMSRAAELESRLLRSYKGSRNVSRYACGLSFGKPSYFVYMLRFLKRC